MTTQKLKKIKISNETFKAYKGFLDDFYNYLRDHGRVPNVITQKLIAKHKNGVGYSILTAGVKAKVLSSSKRGEYAMRGPVSDNEVKKVIVTQRKMWSIKAAKRASNGMSKPSKLKATSKRKYSKRNTNTKTQGTGKFIVLSDSGKVFSKGLGIRKCTQIAMYQAMKHSGTSYYVAKIIKQISVSCSIKNMK